LHKKRKKSNRKIKTLKKRTTTTISDFSKKIDMFLGGGNFSKNKIAKELDLMFDHYFELCDEDDSGTIDK